MNTKKKLFVLLFTCCFCALYFAPISAQGAVKLSQTSITLCRYHSCTLKLNGTTKKVTWKSADKNIATVSKNGKVTAISEGKTTIAATVGNNKYRCKVTVKDYDSETVLAAYGLQALKTIVPDSTTLKINKVWLGSTVANIPFGMLDCEFEDKTGKTVHANVYTYAQEEISTSCFNVKTQFYDKGLIVKFDNQKMDSIQKTRVKKGSISLVKNANKYIFAQEKISVSKGKNFDQLYNWIKL